MKLKRADPAFFTLFERAATFVVEASDALEVLFASEIIDAEAFALLDEIEHKADSNTHDLLSLLERGAEPPLSRRNTRRLINEIDSIVDSAEEAGELALLCRVGRATPIAHEMTVVLAKTAREISSLVGYLNGGTGYRPYVARIHEYEHEGDDLWMRAFGDLFTGEVEPLDIIRWKEIYARIEDAIDRCEETAKFIERALAGTTD
ncbi:MAG TPA: DUF47 family protein [Thermomicrobiales bacterium]|nr:DUF47 family protein [Thermomicrobiales bacterium]